MNDNNQLQPQPQATPQQRIAENRVAAEGVEIQTEPEVQAEVVDEKPKPCIWVIEGCGSLYKKAAALYRPAWQILPVVNEISMINLFERRTVILEKKGQPIVDVMLIRDWKLIDYYGLDVLDEVYVAAELRITGTGEDLTSHPYLAEFAPEVGVNHLSWGDESARALEGKCRCLTLGDKGELVKNIVQKFYVVR